MLAKTSHQDQVELRTIYKVLAFVQMFRPLQNKSLN